MKKNIILADMDAAHRQALAQAIEQVEDFALVGQTGDGCHLLELCRRRNCDIVVMDLVLSSMDGLEVLQKLNSLQPCPAVLVLSGFTSGNVAQLVAGQLADYFMTKPCNINAVLERIDQITRLPVPDPRQSCRSLESTVTDIIHDIGIPAHIQGYQYLREAIVRASRNIHVMDRITKTLYPDIAQHYHTTSSRVERSIRHAIELAWDRGNLDTLHHYFGYTINAARGKPTNAEFISLIADKVQLQMKWHS